LNLRLLALSVQEGSCLFVMPKRKEWSAIESVLNTPPPSGTLF
jgi:hypothetical protein